MKMKLITVSTITFDGNLFVISSNIKKLWISFFFNILEGRRL